MIYYILKHSQCSVTHQIRFSPGLRLGPCSRRSLRTPIVDWWGDTPSYCPLLWRLRRFLGACGALPWIRGSLLQRLREINARAFLDVRQIVYFTDCYAMDAHILLICLFLQTLGASANW